jgi:hypothetical protein
MDTGWCGCIMSASTKSCSRQYVHYVQLGHDVSPLTAPVLPEVEKLDHIRSSLLSTLRLRYKSQRRDEEQRMSVKYRPLRRMWGVLVRREGWIRGCEVL